MPIVTREYVLKTLLVKHAERFAKGKQEVRRRRVGKKAGSVLIEDRPPVPVVPGKLCIPAGSNRLVGYGIKPETRRQHQALLRSHNGDVHVPFALAEADRPERRAS